MASFFFLFLLSHHIFLSVGFLCEPWWWYRLLKCQHPKSTSPERVGACGKESEPAVKDSAQLCAVSPWKHLVDGSKAFLVDHECCAETSLIFVRGMTSQTEVSCLAEEGFNSESVQNYPKEEEKIPYWQVSTYLFLSWFLSAQLLLFITTTGRWPLLSTGAERKNFL